MIRLLKRFKWVLNFDPWFGEMRKWPYNYAQTEQKTHTKDKKDETEKFTFYSTCGCDFIYWSKYKHKHTCPVCVEQY